MATSDQLVHVNYGSIWWTPEGQAEIEIDCKSCSISPKRPIAKIIGSKYGRQNIAGLPDMTGSMEVYLRKDEWAATLGLVPGAKGTLRIAHYDDAHGQAFPVILGEEFTEPVFSDDESTVKVITIPFQLDGPMPNPSEGG